MYTRERRWWRILLHVCAFHRQEICTRHPPPRPCAPYRYAKRSSRACLGVTKLSVGRNATKPSSIAWKTGWA